jgi:predicted Rossmann fold flavoprotein
MLSTQNNHIEIAIVGGGAAGFFAAINAAERAEKLDVRVHIRIFEASEHVLKKVKISGGGRCNVTHFQFDPKRFSSNYPRGSKELLASFMRFQARDTVEWFRNNGVNLVAEEDGRMFPTTNQSDTIIECFKEKLRQHRIHLQTQASISGIKKIDINDDSVPIDRRGKFQIDIKDQGPKFADHVMIATGSSDMGHRLARELGHTITDLAPSLFSFKISDKNLLELSGLSLVNAKTKLIVKSNAPEKNSKDLNRNSEKNNDYVTFIESGPLLITHWGLSGPAILKISAWAAREMKHAGYKAELEVGWLGDKNFEFISQLVKDMKNNNLKSILNNVFPPEIPKRLWNYLLQKWEIDGNKKWADASKGDLHVVAQGLFATKFIVDGKNRYKDEFVECGGVALHEIDFKTMQSKIVPGLYFAGEVLDIDGITGGFNFQNAWTGAWIAAQCMVAPS